MQRSATGPLPGWRVLGFAAVFVVLQLFWQRADERNATEGPVHWLAAQPAARLVNLIDPDIDARAEDRRVLAVDGGIRILNGCEGVELLFLAIAAIAVAPVSLRKRVVALLLAIPMVFAVNQARLVGLFFAYRRDPGLFDLMHAWVAPLVSVAIVIILFGLWLSRSRPDVHRR